MTYLSVKLYITHKSFNLYISQNSENQSNLWQYDIQLIQLAIIILKRNGTGTLPLQIYDFRFLFHRWPTVHIISEALQIDLHDGFSDFKNVTTW